jgi:hypothetical protein
MLDLTGHPKPFTQATNLSKLHSQSGPSLFDLHTHVAARTDLKASTRDRYLGAISTAAEIMNRPLSTITADLALVETRFRLDGFDPGRWSMDDGYQLFRRRLQASLREFLGVHAAQARLRAMEDNWTRLLTAIEPLTAGRVGQGAALHPMKREALKTFALVARGYGWQPQDLTWEKAQIIDADSRGNKRAANCQSLQRLDELRAFPQLLPFLPAHPIGFTADRRVALLQVLDPSWEAQFVVWIDTVTKTGWDPVERRSVDDHVGHAHVMRSAFRTALRIGLGLGEITPDTHDLKAILANDEIMCSIAAEMFARRLRKRKDGHLAPRTSRKYLKLLNQIRGHLGIDTTLLSQVLANNAVAREGKRAEKSMTPKNRKFCEMLVAQPHMRRRFLLSFQTLREAAEAILAAAAAERRDLTPREVSRVRYLGVSACFAAIEIGGAAIRVGNAMALTCFGDDAQIGIPANGKKPIKVIIPAELTKNKSEISFPISANVFKYRDTIQWYFMTIRPLFPHAAGSPYLFPAIKAKAGHLNTGYFGAEFADLMRTVVNLPMTPHQMRHGQTSLLLDQYPNEIEVIAKRIDDTADTLRTFYGWLNALKLVERGQDLLVGLMR